MFVSNQTYKEEKLDAAILLNQIFISLLPKSHMHW